MLLIVSTFQSFAFQVEFVAIFFPGDKGLSEQVLRYFSLKFEIKSDHMLSSSQFTFLQDKYRCIRSKNRRGQLVFLGTHANP